MAGVWRCICTCSYPACSASSSCIPLLGWLVLPPVGHKVVRHGRQCGKRATQIALWFSQHDLVSAAKDFHLVDLKAKLLWQAHGLAIARLEDTSCVHHDRLQPEVYTTSIYISAGGNGTDYSWFRGEMIGMQTQARYGCRFRSMVVWSTSSPRFKRSRISSTTCLAWLRSRCSRKPSKTCSPRMASWISISLSCSPSSVKYRSEERRVGEECRSRR